MCNIYLIWKRISLASFQIVLSEQDKTSSAEASIPVSILDLSPLGTIVVYMTNGSFSRGYQERLSDLHPPPAGTISSNLNLFISF